LRHRSSQWKDIEPYKIFPEEDEIRGMDFHLGIEGTNSNRHGEGRDENMNMVETIKNLHKDVKRNKANN
jgi:hypothetical protein